MLLKVLILVCLLWLPECYAESTNLFEQGRILLEKGDLVKAIPLIYQSATNGNQWAQLQMGIFYLDPKYHDVKTNTAIYWVSMAAQQGNNLAAKILTRFGYTNAPVQESNNMVRYFDGSGHEISYVTAITTVRQRNNDSITPNSIAPNITPESLRHSPFCSLAGQAADQEKDQTDQLQQVLRENSF